MAFIRGPRTRRPLRRNPARLFPGHAYQIFKYRDHAYAVQFHVEVRADTVRQWGCIPEYRAALENSLGADALDSFDQLAREHMPEMNRLAKLLYDNFKGLL